VKTKKIVVIESCFSIFFSCWSFFYTHTRTQVIHRENERDRALNRRVLLHLLLGWRRDRRIEMGSREQREQRERE